MKKDCLPTLVEREIDLRGASFDTFLAHAFDRDSDAWQVSESQDLTTLLHVDAALQLAHAERLFRNPSSVAHYSSAQRQQGFWFLPGKSQPDFFSGQLWNHDLPAGARISCINAFEVLYRDLFAKDPLDVDAYMWFDLLEENGPTGSAEGRFCPVCIPVRRALIGVLQNILAIGQPDCARAALHGLNHWGTPAERAAIIDPWLATAPAALLDAPPPTRDLTLRQYAPSCRAGKAQ